MRFDPLSKSGQSVDDSPLYKRLLWMAAFWAMGVAVIGFVGFVIRIWIKT